MSDTNSVSRLNPLTWPLSFKVPLLVAVLMFTVSAIITNRVLARLEENQEQHLEQLASAYLDGLSASLIPSVFRGDVWEVFDTLDRSRERYRGLNVRWTIVTNAEGKILAASDPAKFPSDTVAEKEVLAHFTDDREVILNEDKATAFLLRPLPYQDREIGKIYAEADIGALLQERSDVLRTLLITNLLLTLVLAIVGYLAVLRMMRPVRIMSLHLDQASQG
ncbi:MAG: sensor histidine kinase, partial [Aestuariivirga sp.]